MEMEFRNLTMPSKKKMALTLVMLFLVATNIFFGFQYFVQAQEIASTQKVLKKQQTNARVITFLNLFIQKVLKTDKEISFEDRLQLENAIRNINDADLLAKWEKFIAGKSETEIQQDVKDLLEALVNKISY